MPHPSSTTLFGHQDVDGWGSQAFGSSRWGGSTRSGVTTGGQVVIRHDRSTTKKKRLRQRQRMN